MEWIDFQPSRVDRQNRLKSSGSIFSRVESIRSTRSISRSMSITDVTLAS